MKIIDIFFRLSLTEVSPRFKVRSRRANKCKAVCNHLVVFFLAVSAFLVIPTALASPKVESQDTDEWVIWATPYLWGLSLDGQARVGEEQETVDVGFSDIIDDFNIGAMGFLDGRKGKFGFFINPIYSQLTSKDNVDGTNIDVTSDTAILAIGGYYRWLDKSVAGSAGQTSGRLIIEPYLGVRWTYMGVEIDAGDEGKVDETVDWFDPFFGVRASYAWNQNWDVAAAADVGVSGIGSDSTWNLTVLFRHKLKLIEHDMIFEAGYRALYQDYDTGSGGTRFEWDVKQHGPIVGVSIKL